MTEDITENMLNRDKVHITKILFMIKHKPYDSEPGNHLI